ncbi:dienelactone hydrolase family protein [Haloferula sp.]|uniref:dienelactone hydrolase family protein n=1 Tax=Haloferula sp. TaxID=2497595 RepID=UPI00329D94B4
MNSRFNHSVSLPLILGLASLSLVLPLKSEEESLAPLDGKPAPKNHDDLWSGYDPRKEPLDVEVVKEWEEDGVTMRVVRYRIGIFNGRKAMMAGVYGFPKGATDLPGLVQIHGGGQYAHSNAVLTNAKRGYATISISWAGRISTRDYKVNPDGVKLFWDDKTEDPDYRLTTDWATLDAYHAPCRNQQNNFASTKPQAWTLDTVDSPRNNPWFLVTLGARRALTFLEQQAEVDGQRLGVYGHSMGGKLTVLTTAADDRVKAAAPSCGGISNRSTGDALYDATVADDVSLKRIKCPIIFLSPSNDFHGRINDLQTAITEIKSNEWRTVCSPQHNHQDTAPYMITGLLWMDQFLKGSFRFPATPTTTLSLKGPKGVPSFRVEADGSQPALAVDVFYTRDGQMGGEKDDRENTKQRFWKHAVTTMKDGVWTADLPLSDTDRPLWVYANVHYPLDPAQSGASYYYSDYTADQFVISSRMNMVTPDELQASGVQGNLESQALIEAFNGEWEKEWYTYKPEQWGRRTYKLRDHRFLAPSPDAALVIDVQSDATNTLIVGLDSHAATVSLRGGNEWQEVKLDRSDFKDSNGATLADWSGIRELRLLSEDKLETRVNGVKNSLKLGGKWSGPNPNFRKLRWETASE